LEKMKKNRNSGISGGRNAADGPAFRRPQNQGPAETVGNRAATTILLPEEY
jgi:hypothetical protein